MSTITVMRESEVIVSEVTMGDRFLKRLVGLSNRKKMETHQGFLLKPCNQIHTFGMHFPIDAVFLSKDEHILHIEQYMTANRISKHIKQAQCVLEISGNMTKVKNLKVGDRLTFIYNSERERGWSHMLKKHKDSEALFDKAIFGISQAQVAEYIAHQEDNLKRASEIFEEKLEEMKNTIDLLTKEKEGYAQKVEALKQQLKVYQSKCEEYGKISSYNSQMKEDYSALEMENEKLRAQLEPYKAKAEQSAKLEDTICDLNARASFYEKEIESLKTKNKEITAELMEDNKKLEVYISDKRTAVAQGLKNHKYGLKKVKILLDSLNETFEETNSSFENIEAF